MATVTYVIKNSKSKDETPVYMVFRVGNSIERPTKDNRIHKDSFRIKISIGKKIRPEYWNQAKRRARERATFKHDEFNGRLTDIETGIISIYENHLKNNGGLLPTTLRREFMEYLHPKPRKEPPAPPTLLKFIDQFIQTCNKSPRTKLSYGTTKGILERYSKTLPAELTFADINMDFYNDFQKHCFKKESKALNTFGDHIKKIKVFMNEANDRGYTTNQGHKHRNFKTLDETSDTVYLNDREIMTLYQMDLSNDPKLDRVRDLFIIGCQTGLRFSDLSQLKPANIIKFGTMLKIKTAKTGETVEVPLHWMVKEILKKYNGTPPRAISNQKMNVYIKQIARKEEAKLSEKATTTITRAGFKVATTVNKSELITTHTARRSFATNMFLDGFPTISIMKVTGHKTEKAFLRYIKISAEQNAEKMKEHERFTGTTGKVAKL